MRLTNIRYSNVKGHAAAVDLSPVTVIKGPNFSHKTTLPIAIRLAMAGKLPPPIGTMGIYDSLAGDPEKPGTMAIQCTFDGSQQFEVVWTKNKQGKVSSPDPIPAKFQMPDMMLDPGLFFAKTRDEQIRTLFEACEVDQAAVDMAGMHSIMGDIQASPVSFRDETIKAIRAYMTGLEQKRPQDTFSELISMAKMNQKAARDEAKVKKGAFEAFKGTGEIPQDHSAEIAELRAKVGNPPNLKHAAHIAELERQLNQPLPDEGFTVENMTALCKFAEEGLKAAGIEACELEDEYSNAVISLNNHSRQLTALQAKADELAAKLKDLESVECCPYCRSAKKGWKNVVSEELQSQLADALANKEAKEGDLIVFGHKRDSLSEISKLLNKAAKVKLWLDTREELLNEWKALKMDDEEAPEQDNEARERLEMLEREQSAFTVYYANRTRRETLEQELLRAQCKEEVYKACVGIFTAAQAKVVEGVFHKVLNVATHFTNGLLNSKLEFSEGELGRRISQQDVKQGNSAPIGSWIPFKSFSGTERILALAGLSVALTNDAPCKIVILDEMGNLDLNRRTEVAMRMLQLVDAGVIDQAILIDVDERPYVPLAQRQNFKLMAV